MPVDRKEAAREGLVRIGREVDLGGTALWTRVNALDSPVGARRPADARRRDRRPARRDHGPQGRGRVGHPLRRPAARPARGQARARAADPRARDPRDGARRRQRRGDRRRLAAHAGHELRPGRPRRLAADEDDARRRRPSRLRRARRPRPPDDPEAPRASAQQDLWHYSIARMVDACAATGILPVLRPVRRHRRRRRLRGAVPRRVPDGLRRRLVAAPAPDRDRQARVLARPRGGAVRARR